MQSLIHICKDCADEYDVLFFNESRSYLWCKGHDCHVKNCFITVNNVP